MSTVNPILNGEQRRQLRLMFGIPLLWVGLVCLVAVATGQQPLWSVPVAMGGFAAFAAGIVLLLRGMRP